MIASGSALPWTDNQVLLSTAGTILIIVVISLWLLLLKVRSSIRAVTADIQRRFAGQEIMYLGQL